MSKDDLVLGHGASRPLSTKELEDSIDRVFKKAIDWKDRAEKAEARIAEVERERKTAIDLFQHEQDRAESAERRAEELRRAYDEYVALLNEEIGNLVGLATIHGWKSDLVEAGKAARAKIAALAAGEGET